MNYDLVTFVTEREHQITYLQTCARCKYSVQPAHSCSLVRIFTESILYILIAKDEKFLHADNKDSNQTARMRRLIRVSVGCTFPKVSFLILWLNYSCLPPVSVPSCCLCLTLLVQSVSSVL